MGCIKRGGKGISHPRGDFLPMGGVRAHGVCEEGWERDFPPTGGWHTHGGMAHTWGEFLLMDCQKKSPNRCGTVGAFFRLSFSVIGVT